MKILYFTDTYLPQINGVTNTLEKLGKYLQGNETEYKIFAPYYDYKASLLEDPHIHRFNSISLPAYPECRLSLPFYYNLCQLADKFNPDIIHLMTPVGLGITGLRYAQERNLPVVSSYTTSFDEYLKYYKLDFLNPILWTLFKWFHNSCKINFCPSKDTMNGLKYKGIKNLKIWSRGIDTETFSPSYRSEELRFKLNIQNKISILYVGRLAKEKDLDILMESIKILNNKYYNHIRFIIAGDGPYGNVLIKESPDNVSFTGYLTGTELSSLYSSCDIFAFPSSTETFGNVVLEAMASGLPVVGVKSGGVLDSIIDGYNGLLCTPRDSISFSECISSFLKDPEMLRRLGNNARNYSLKKSWNSIFNMLTYDYRILLKEHYPEIGLPA